jgi:hypothetical protein
MKKRRMEIQERKSEPVTHLQLLVCFGKVGGAIKGQAGLQRHASSGKSQRVRVGCRVKVRVRVRAGVRTWAWARASALGLGLGF